MSATKLLLLSVLIATGGQVCFKKGMSIIGEISVDKIIFLLVLLK